MKSFSFIVFYVLALLVYHSEAAKKWLPEVSGYNKNDANNGYAGVIGTPITGLRVSGGQNYRVHLQGQGWLPPVNGNDENDFDNGYAGSLNGNIIDGVAIDGGVQYAVHIQGGQWLPTVNGYNTSDDNNGYAGVLGKPIDAIMIKGRRYATSYNENGTTPYNPNVPEPVSNTLEEKINIIYNYFVSSVPGTTKQGVAAILGCWDIESGIEPKRAEGDYLNPPVGAPSKNDSCWDDVNWLSMTGYQIYGDYPRILKRGLGLGQWTDTPGSPRNTNLRNYANQKGKKWYDLSLQLDFMLHGDDPYAINIAKRILTSSDTVNNLTSSFLCDWEGVCGDKLADRQQSANNLYNYLVQHF